MFFLLAHLLHLSQLFCGSGMALRSQFSCRPWLPSQILIFVHSRRKVSPFLAFPSEVPVVHCSCCFRRKIVFFCFSDYCFCRKIVFVVGFLVFVASIWSNWTNDVQVPHSIVTSYSGIWAGFRSRSHIFEISSKCRSQQSLLIFRSIISGKVFDISPSVSATRLYPSICG